MFIGFCEGWGGGDMRRNENFYILITILKHFNTGERGDNGLLITLVPKVE